MYKLVAEEFPRELERLAPQAKLLKLTGSSGQGNILAAPWIASFDKRITSSAMSGYYPVYLFSIDHQRVYLSLALGVTQFANLYGENKKSIQKIREGADRFRNFLLSYNLPNNLSLTDIDLETKNAKWRYQGYEAGTVFAFPAYDVEAMPTTEELGRDYRAILDLYHIMSQDPTIPTMDDLVEATASIVAPENELELQEFEPRPAKKSGSGRTGTSSGPRRSSDSQKVGDAGELAVLGAEKNKLIVAGRQDLADRVDHLASRRETPGWDISSFLEDGTAICIEVKSTKGRTMTSVELTRNEWVAAKDPKRKANYYIYLVSNALAAQPKIEVLRDPHSHVEADKLSISASVYELSLRSNK
jgi:hypothetical protein